MGHNINTRSCIAWAEISLPAIKHNLSLIRKSAPQAKIIAVLKADAYGHGAIEIARSIHVDAVAVARLEEGIALRNSAIKQRIIVLSPLINESTVGLAQQFDLDLVIHSTTGAEFILSKNFSRVLNIWVKIDTGMHRLGLLPDTALELLPNLSKHPSLKIMSLMSHFSSSDETRSQKNHHQLSLMQSISQKFPDLDVCFANSGAVLFHPQAHFNWIRTGIMLYGINPSATENSISTDFIPAMTLKAKVLDVKPVSRGDTVGYNGRWIAEHDSRIATIGIGYGDGYPRHASSGTPVLINNKKFPLAGTVSMDIITVDVGDANIKPGDIATLWGEDLSTSEIASHTDTIAYELVTRLSQRVTKLFINGPDDISMV